MQNFHATLPWMLFIFVSAISFSRALFTISTLPTLTDSVFLSRYGKAFMLVI
jgi:hypothetical protein